MKIIKTIAIVFLLISCDKKEQFMLQTFPVKQGWGYVITMHEKTIIRQTIIPTLSQKRSFKSEADALIVGNLVLQRIKQNLSPTIAKKDLILLEISL